MISYQHSIILSSYHSITTRNGWSHFWCQLKVKTHILSRLPLRQGSLPKNKGTLGNNFLRRTCWWRSEIHSSSKTPVSWKQKIDLQFVSRKIFSASRKWKTANRLKHVLPKFGGCPSYVWGVNDSICVENLDLAPKMTSTEIGRCFFKKKLILEILFSRNWRFGGARRFWASLADSS